MSALTLPVRPPSAPRRSRLTAAGLSAALGCLLFVTVMKAPGPAVRRPVPPPSPAPAPAPARADEAAVLFNNTPLAIAPADAVALNAARGLDRVRLPAARPFLLGAAAGAGAALDCLTQAIYYEAASESDRGERAVAQVVLNRLRSPIFPHSVCGVVFQGAELPTGCQFSFTCDGSLVRMPSAAGWARARRIAAAALAGYVERSVGLSTHYHANYVVPYWAGSLDKVATIGAHIFYTMRGARGRPAAFGSAYAGAEAPPALLLDAGQLDRLAGGETLAGVGGSPERTQVVEDALGVPAASAPAAAPSAGALKADETRGELIADRVGGRLTDGR